MQRPQSTPQQQLMNISESYGFSPNFKAGY